jgi:hypothetical protein
MARATVTRAVLAAETAAITTWAARHGWDVRIDEDGLTLEAGTVHPASQATIVFHADLDGYPALPPAWTCRDSAGEVTPSAFPLPGTRPGVSGSIFHPGLVICAPWNRLAYATHGGPHNDWGDLTGWKTVSGGHSQAHTLPDMLTALALHLSVSPGSAA